MTIMILVVWNIRYVGVYFGKRECENINSIMVVSKMSHIKLLGIADVCLLSYYLSFGIQNHD